MSKKVIPPLLVSAIESIIFPPGINIILFLVAIMFWHRCRKIAIFLVMLSSLSLYLLSTPFFSKLLVLPLEKAFPPLSLSKLRQEKAQAIVVLGGGEKYAPEYKAYIPSNASSARLDYAVYLHEKSRLPILLSGGAVLDDPRSEASIMNKRLVALAGFSSTWLDKHSINTSQNARDTKVLLSKKGVNKIILVTSAYHMRRAMYAFRKEGISVIAAPTDYHSGKGYQFTLQQFMIYPSSLRVSHLALHEYIAELWYKFLAIF